MHEAKSGIERLVAYIGTKGYRAGLVAALLVTLPTIWAGLFADDYVHILSIEGKVPMTTPFDLFNFAPGDPETLLNAMGKTPYPWFTYPELKIRFFRLLSCATMVADHSLFGRNAAAYHLHSLLWYLALVGAVVLLYRRAFPGALGVLVLMLYAVDDGHAIAAGWWSNRNAIVAAAPALLGLAAHLRWREEQWRPGLPLSLLGYSVGLLGGETALGVLGYVLAYELCANREPWLRRIRALVPAGGLALAYLIFYKSQGYGVSGSGLYLDPLGEMPQFLAHAPGRFFLLSGAQFMSLPSEAPIVAAATKWPLAIIGAAVLLMGVRLLWQVWPRLAAEEQRHLRWMILGGAISTVPVLATFASGRLLTLPSVGGAAVIAVLIRHWWRTRGPSQGRTWRTVGWTLVFVHLVVSPFVWIAFSAGARFVDARGRSVVQSAEIDPVRAPDQLVVQLNAADPLMGMYPLILRTAAGEPEGRGWLTLSMVPCDLRVTRTAANALRLEVLDGELLASEFEKLFRSPSARFDVGDAVVLREAIITIEKMGNSGPRAILAEFKQSLDDPGYCFLEWRENRHRRFILPSLGESVEIPAAKGFFNAAFILDSGGN